MPEHLIQLLVTHLLWVLEVMGSNSGWVTQVIENGANCSLLGAQSYWIGLGLIGLGSG